MREFRVLWLGQLGSSVGSWMQTFAVGLYIDNLTKEGLWVGLATAAQLAPLLFVPIIGGVAADRFDRRHMLMTLQSLQLVFALGLALAVAGNHNPSKLLILSLIFAGGVCNALNAPAWAAVLPTLVGTENLPGAISLNSAAINGSRVIGPALAGQLYPYLGASWLFVINAATFLFIIASLFTIRLPNVAEARRRRGTQDVGDRLPCRSRRPGGRLDADRHEHLLAALLVQLADDHHRRFGGCNIPVIFTDP